MADEAKDQKLTFEELMVSTLAMTDALLQKTTAQGQYADSRKQQIYG